MIGRSNLQQAIPVTFGYKMAGLLSRSSAIASASRS
jgi:adenylosuccinate lyase